MACKIGRRELEQGFIEFKKTAKEVVQDIGDQFEKSISPDGLKVITNAFKAFLNTGIFICDNYFPDQKFFAGVDKKFGPIKTFAGGLSLIPTINQWLTDPTKGGAWKTTARVFSTISGVADASKTLEYLGLISHLSANVKVLGVAFEISAGTIKNSSVVLGSIFSIIDSSVQIAKICQKAKEKRNWQEFIKPVLSVAFSVGKVAIIIFAGPQLTLFFIVISIGTSTFGILKQVWTTYLEREETKKRAAIKEIEKEMVLFQYILNKTDKTDPQYERNFKNLQASIEEWCKLTGKPYKQPQRSVSNSD